MASWLYITTDKINRAFFSPRWPKPGHLEAFLSILFPNIFNRGQTQMRNSWIPLWRPMFLYCRRKPRSVEREKVQWKSTLDFICHLTLGSREWPPIKPVSLPANTASGMMCTWYAKLLFTVTWDSVHFQDSLTHSIYLECSSLLVVRQIPISPSWLI